MANTIKRFIFLTLAFIPLLSQLGLGSSAPELILNTHNGWAPLTVTTRTVITPNAANREVCVTWDSPDAMFGAHCVPINGENAPITFWFEIKNLTPGEYVLKAILFKSDGSNVNSTDQHLTVLSTR